MSPVGSTPTPDNALTGGRPKGRILGRCAELSGEGADLSCPGQMREARHKQTLATIQVLTAGKDRHLN